MIRKAEIKDASRLAEILIFAKRTAYRQIFNNDNVSFNEMQVLDLALDFRDKESELDNLYVYDDGIVKGLIKWGKTADKGAEIRNIKFNLRLSIMNGNLKGSFIMGELSKLPNIGKEVERQLNKVGIFTYDELKDIGAEQAWLKIQEIDASACIHRLLALEGAILGVKKTALLQECKAELKDFYNRHKGK